MAGTNTAKGDVKKEAAKRPRRSSEAIQAENLLRAINLGVIPRGSPLVADVEVIKVLEKMPEYDSALHRLKGHPIVKGCMSCGRPYEEVAPMKKSTPMEK